MTVNDLATASLKLIGVTSKTQSPASDESADVLARLNDMVDAWAAQRTLIYQVVRSVYALIASQASYTIGQGAPAADWVAVRPEEIEHAGIIDTSVSPSQELPAGVLSDQEWAALTIKGQTATRAFNIYDDFAYPNSRIAVWPIPTIGTLQVALYVPTPVSQFASLASTVVLPPGYAEAIRYNLAVRLAPEFGRKLDPTIAAIALSSLATIQRANRREHLLGIDAALRGTGRNDQFDWINGVSR